MGEEFLNSLLIKCATQIIRRNNVVAEGRYLNRSCRFPKIFVVPVPNSFPQLRYSLAAMCTPFYVGSSAATV